MTKGSLLLFSCQVVSDSSRPHGWQHARIPCPLPSPWVCPKFICWTVMPSNHLILCCPLLLLPSIFPSIRVFSNESAHHIRLPKYWSFSFNISATKEYSGLISFRTDYSDLLVVQETLNSLLQHNSLKAWSLQYSAFLMSNSHISTWLLEKP